MGKQRLAAVMLALGLALLVWSFIPGYGPQDTVFSDTEWMLPEDASKPVTAVGYRPLNDPDPTHNLPLAFKSNAADADGDRVVIIYLRKLYARWYTVDITRGGEVESREVQVLDKRLGLVAVAGALLAVLAAPAVLIRDTPMRARIGQRLVPVTGWAYLLMEPTGLSIARLQLVLLFVPSAVVYVGLAFPLHTFPHVPDSIWQLLGIGGASAALATLITPGKVAVTTSLPVPDAMSAPAQAQAVAVQPPDTRAQDSLPAMAAVAPPGLATAADGGGIEVKPPSFTDFFAEGSGYGDISLYQSFVMCVITAVVFVVSFFDTWKVPDIPDQVLQLLGTSLAVYLGVKGIKVIKKPDAAQG
jgi:hypothetical protein